MVFELSPGTHSLFLFKEGHEPIYRDIDVKEDENTSISFPGSAAATLVNHTFSDSTNMSSYDTPSIAVTHETSGDNGNGYVSVANDTSNYYCHVNMPTGGGVAAPYSYGVTFLGYTGDHVSMMIGSNTADGTYSFGDVFAYEQQSDPAGTWLAIESEDVPGIPASTKTRVIVVGLPGRIIVLQGGAMIINHVDENGVTNASDQRLSIELNREATGSTEMTMEIDNTAVHTF